MLITSVLNNEAKRNEQMILEYQQLLETLPKGSLICRKNYYYLKYRDGKKVVTKYIGKDAEDTEELIEKRKHAETMMKSLEEELKIANKALEGRVW